MDNTVTSMTNKTEPKIDPLKLVKEPFTLVIKKGSELANGK